jgi:dTDP-4-dehydrorhamnose reductase
VVIHCAALLDLVWMHDNRAAAWHLMVEGTRTLAEACRDVGGRFIFVSSDWVFDGMEPLIDETSPPHPVNFYGIMKTSSERELSMMQDLNYGIARLAGVFGENIAVRSLTRRDQGLGFDMGNYVIKRLMAGQVADVWAGPKVNDVAHATLASDGADMLLRLARHEENGIFHCWGSESISRLDFALMLAEAFGYEPGLVKPVPTDPEVLKTHVNVRIPFRIRASNEQTVTALGREPLKLKEAVSKFKQEWDDLNA